MSAKAASEVVKIRWKQIHVPDTNIRRHLGDVKDLAESLDKNGQEEPVTVSNGGAGDQPYILRRGFRRMAAFEMNGWQDKDVICVVQEYKKGDAITPLIDNWIVNVDRKDFSALDQGEFIASLLEGTYPVADGETTKQLSKDDVADKLRISKQQIGKFLKVFENIDADVAKLARKAEAPQRLLIAISNIEGTGRTEEEKAETKAEAQMARLQEHINDQKELLETGRKRKPKKASSSKKDNDGPVGIIRDNQKLSHATYKEKQADGEEKAYTVAEMLQVLQEKQTKFTAEKGQDAREKAIRLEGVIEGFRFAKGEVKKIKDVNKADFSVLYVEEVKEAEEAEEVEE